MLNPSASEQRAQYVEEHLDLYSAIDQISRNCPVSHAPVVMHRANRIEIARDQF